MKTTTKLEHLCNLRETIRTYLEYRYVLSYFNDFMLDNIRKASFQLMNFYEETEITPILALIDEKRHEESITSINGLIEAIEQELEVF